MSTFWPTSTVFQKPPRAFDTLLRASTGFRTGFLVLPRASASFQRLLQAPTVSVGFCALSKPSIGFRKLLLASVPFEKAMLNLRQPFQSWLATATYLAIPQTNLALHVSRNHARVALELQTGNYQNFIERFMGSCLACMTSSTCQFERTGPPLGDQRDPN